MWKTAAAKLQSAKKTEGAPHEQKPSKPTKQEQKTRNGICSRNVCVYTVESQVESGARVQAQKISDLGLKVWDLSFNS